NRTWLTSSVDGVPEAHAQGRPHAAQIAHGKRRHKPQTIEYPDEPYLSLVEIQYEPRRDQAQTQEAIDRLKPDSVVGHARIDAALDVASPRTVAGDVAVQQLQFEVILPVRVRQIPSA